MTPEEIEITMDFILRSQADSVVRMDRLEERMEAADKRFQFRADHLQEKLDLLASAARDLLQAERSHGASIRRMEKAIETLAKIADGHSKRITRLEGKGR
jgi:hypothetical protein